MRHAFNLREGINPLTRNVPGRMIGDPPLKAGNVKDITVDYKTLVTEFLEKIGWDTRTTIPRAATLQKLNMEFLIDEMK
jgi:aldehyde:ferredoxin oxidoreductase